jgi:hypothetical protein
VPLCFVLCDNFLVRALRLFFVALVFLSAVVVLLCRLCLHCDMQSLGLQTIFPPCQLDGAGSKGTLTKRIKPTLEVCNVS